MDLKSIKYEHEKNWELRNRGHTIGGYATVNFLLLELDVSQKRVEELEAFVVAEGECHISYNTLTRAESRVSRLVPWARAYASLLDTLHDGDRFLPALEDGDLLPTEERNPSLAPENFEVEAKRIADEIDADILSSVVEGRQPLEIPPFLRSPPREKCPVCDGEGSVVKKS